MINIGQGKFPINTQQQSNPAITGLSQAIMRHLQFQQSQKNKQLLPFVAPQAQANLQHTQLGNQADEAQLPYVGPQAQANLNKTQIGTQGTQLRNAAQAILNKFLPQAEQARIGNLNSRTDYMKQGGSSGMRGVNLQNLNALEKVVQERNPNLDENQVKEGVDAYLEGDKALADGTPLASPNGRIRELVDNLNLHTNTAAANNQQRAASAVDAVLKQADDIKDSAFKYSGALGRGKLQASRLAASLGKEDPDYLNYMNFTRELLPTLANMVLKLEGSNVTDAQKKLVFQSLDPITLDSNPGLVPKQFEYLKNLYKSLSKSVSLSPTEIRNANLKGIPNASEKSNSSTDTYLDYDAQGNLVKSS